MRSCEKRSRQFQKYKKDRYSFEQDHASMIKNHVRRKTIFPIPTHLIKTYFEFKKNVLITCSISNPPTDDKWRELNVKLIIDCRNPVN